MSPSRKSSRSGLARDSGNGETVTPEGPLHRAIYEQLLSEIQSGVYKPGERLPSEAVLCERFQASRITVARAFQTLQREHLVTRRPGSGTYVEKPARQDSLQFGLLIPDLGTTDIFEPICQGIMRSPAARFHSLTWGHSTGQEKDLERAAEQLCQQYITQKVAGVFFAPAEFTETRSDVNRTIACRLQEAGVTVVLLDRCFETYPKRSHFDLVGIDNHRAGRMLTDHLLETGARRIVFAMRPHSASTVEARLAGYRDALFSFDQRLSPSSISGNFEDPAWVRRMLDRERPDAIVCANDYTAAHLMQTLISLGVRIPEDIKMVGVDDVTYAKLLPTQLTTIRQNCAEIGAVAMAVMLDRLAHPSQPVKDILIRTELVVRASSCSNVVN
jgi:GntR family transcriptional regulator, arabinose operon transcriptional repressor